VRYFEGRAGQFWGRAMQSRCKVRQSESWARQLEAEIFVFLIDLS